jgi:hypothetical protein
MSKVSTTGHKVDPQGVNHAPHYNYHPSGVECNEIKRHLTGNLADAFKYVFRRDDKENPLKDLKKAVWYFEDQVKNRQHIGRMNIPAEVYVLLLKVALAEKNTEAKDFYFDLYEAIGGRPLYPHRNPKSFEDCLNSLKKLEKYYEIMFDKPE